MNMKLSKELKHVDFNKLAAEIHDNNVDVGWWDGEQCLYTKLQLISTEVAEATEGERKDLMDDKIPTRKMGEVELADALIRALDLGGHLGLIYQGNVVGHHFSKFSKTTIGRKHYCINKFMIKLGDTIEEDQNLHSKNLTYSGLINTIINVSKSLGYDIFNAMIEKLEFNQTRADHKRANRAKKHGKQF